MSKSCICYVRTGTENQNQFHEQVASVEKFARKKGYRISQIFDDFAVSGNTLDGREGLDEAMNYINENPEVKVLIVENLDRLARTEVHNAFIRGFLREHNVELLSVNQPFIGESAEQQLLTNIAAGMHAYEARIMSSKIKLALQHRAERGETPFALPLGYRRNGQTVKTDEEVAKTVTQIFRLYQSGKYSINALAARLHKQNFKTSKGKPFKASSLYSLLKNPFYIGIIAFRGKHYKGKHRPIISKEIFDQCQQVIHSRSRKMR